MTEKQGRGRPKSGISRYDKYIKGREEEIKQYLRAGDDNKTLCKRLGFGTTTLCAILNENPEMRIWFRECKDKADAEVEAALYKRALGYDYEETTQEVDISSGVAIPKSIKKVKKHVVGDTTAQIFWLKNRNPERWSDKMQVEQEITTDLDLSALSTEELTALNGLLDKTRKK